MARPTQTDRWRRGHTQRRAGPMRCTAPTGAPHGTERRKSGSRRRAGLTDTVTDNRDPSSVAHPTTDIVNDQLNTFRRCTYKKLDSQHSVFSGDAQDTSGNTRGTEAQRRGAGGRITRLRTRTVSSDIIEGSGPTAQSRELPIYWWLHAHSLRARWAPWWARLRARASHGQRRLGASGR